MVMTDKLHNALAELADMSFPSVEQILRDRGFNYEANRVKMVVDAYREASKLEPEEGNINEANK